MKISFYLTQSGASPVEKYIRDLQKKEKEVVAATLELLVETDLENPLIHAKPIEGRLWELVIRKEQIFYVLVKGPILVLLQAYKKQSQKAPKREIVVARNRMNEIIEELEGKPKGKR